jgi:transposase
MLRNEPTGLIAGVDTHTDTHTLAILTEHGAVVSTATYTADGRGYASIIDALATAGPVRSVAVEGTNSYGAGLTRALQSAGHTVLEVLRPTRQVRRMKGKSDPVDAVEAARTVLSGRGISVPKDTNTAVESIRFLLAARKRFVSSMTSISNAIKALLITAPEPVRAKYRAMETDALLRRLAGSRPGSDLVDPANAAVLVMKTMACAHQELSDRVAGIETQLHDLVKTHHPALLDVYGVGILVAAQLAVTAGGNPQRIRNEASFAALCGAAPIPASSGRTHRHRLNRGGDRQGNAALHRIALVRMRHDPKTRTYVERRTHDGKSKKEIIRCLKRAIVREVYRALTSPASRACHADLRTIRTTKKITLTQAAVALNTWPARISDIERKARPLPELATRYRNWLATA